MTQTNEKVVAKYDIVQGKLIRVADGFFGRLDPVDPPRGLKTLVVTGPSVHVVHYRLVSRDGDERNARRITMKATGETWWEWEE